MHCPFCGAEDTKVYDSRLAPDGDQIRRRRECVSCQTRFTTFESAELQLPRVVKTDGARETFNPDKVRVGLSRALEKRPVSTDEIDAAIDRIRRRLMSADAREVQSRQIGEMVMDELKGMDHVAYVRFASVYRNFEDVGEFADEIERLAAGPSPELRRHQIDLIKPDK